MRSLVIVAALAMILVGCGATPAFQYRTEVTVAADSMADARSMLDGLRYSLSQEGYRVDSRPSALSARRDWRFVPTEDLAQRQERYAIVVGAVARESSLTVSIEGREDQLVSPSMWERRWTPWVARSASQIRDRVNAVAAMVRLDYPRAAQGGGRE